MKAIDLSFIDETNTILGAIVVLADYIFGEHWLLFLAFLFLNILDYFTGVAKSKVLKTESSAGGLKGVLKKFAYWVIIMLSFMMSPIFNELGTVMGADITPFTPVIGYMILAMLIMNEFRSILENLYTCGVDVPPLLMNGLSVFEKVANDVQAKIFDGVLNVQKREKEENTYVVNLDVADKDIEHKDSVTLRIRTIDMDDEGGQT